MRFWKKMVIDDDGSVFLAKGVFEGLKAEFLKCGGVWRVVQFIEKE